MTARVHAFAALALLALGEPVAAAQPRGRGDGTSSCTTVLVLSFLAEASAALSVAQLHAIKRAREQILARNH